MKPDHTKSGFDRKRRNPSLVQGAHLFCSGARMSMIRVLSPRLRLRTTRTALLDVVPVRLRLRLAFPMIMSTSGNTEHFSVREKLKERGARF